MTPQPPSLFISYSHTDSLLCDEFTTALSVLVSQGRLTVWRDRHLTAGQPWQGVIDDHLNTARFLVLLLSDRFFQSEQCKREMARALERQAAGEAILISVILEPCDWPSTALANLVVLPKDGKPITDWPTHSHAWQNVVSELRRIIDGDRQVLGIPVVKIRRWKWALIAALSLPELLIAGLAWWSSQQRTLQEADSLLDIGRYSEAEPLFRKAQLWNPLNSRATAGLEIIQLAALRTNAPRFRTKLDSLIKRTPNEPHLKVLQGDVLAAEGDTLDALHLYQEATRLDPKLAEAWFRIGVLYDLDKDPTEAIAQFQKAVDLAPESPHYRTNLATEFAAAGAYDRALHEFQIVMTTAQFPLAAIEAGKIFRRQGRDEDAAHHFRLALDWLKAESPETSLPWSFDTDKDRFQIPDQATKTCYAALELETITRTSAPGCTPDQRTFLKPLIDSELKQH